MTLSELRAEYRRLKRLYREKIGAIRDDTPEADVRRITTEADRLFLQIDEVADKIEAALDEEDRSAIDISRRPGQGERITWRADGRRDDDEGVTFALRPEHRMVDRVRERGVEEFDGLALGDYLRSMITGARTDAERRALAEGTDSAGGYTVPEILSAQLIDAVRNATVSVRAGARTVQLTSDTNHVAKVATDPVPAWRAENAAVAESDPTFTRITFAPKTLAVLIKASRELLDDSLNIGTELPRIISAALAVELDRAVLFGSGTGSEPTGLVNVSGINTISHGAALTNYVPFVRARTKITQAKHPGITAFILHPRDAGALAELMDTTNQPMMPPKLIAETPFLETTAVPTGGSPDDTDIIAGDFARLLIGLRNAVRIDVLRERYADNYQYGFLAALRADVAVEHATAFTKITGVLTPPL